MGDFHRLVVPELVQPLLKSSRLALASQMKKQGKQPTQSTPHTIHKRFRSSPWNVVCFVIFTLFAINAIVTWFRHPKDSKDDKTHPEDTTNGITQFTFLLCATAVGLRALLFLLYKIVNLQDTTAKVVLLALYAETLFVVVSSYIIHFDETYSKYALLCQGPLLSFVVVITSFFPLQSRKEANNELSQKTKVVEKEVMELRSENDKLREDNATSNKALGEMNIAYNEQTKKTVLVENEKVNLEEKMKLLRSQKNNIENEMKELKNKNRELKNCLIDRVASKRQIEAQNVRMEEEALKLLKLKLLNELQLYQKSQVEELPKRNDFMDF